MRIGYFLSTEEYTPAELVAQARAAEQAGFHGLWISDHFHPWNNEQGNSPFVWSVIGAISQVCDLPVTTAVTCPTVRIAPGDHRPGRRHLRGAARAAGSPSASAPARRSTRASSADRGRPPTSASRCSRRRSTLIRELWTGEVVTSHRGRHYTVEHARIYNVPETPPEIFVSGVRAQGRRGGRADRRRLHRHLARPRPGGPVQGAVRRQARAGRREGRLRPDPGGGLGARPPALAELRPARRDGADPADARSTSSRRPSWSPWTSTRESVVAGNDPEQHLEQIRQYADAGYDELYVANMGPHYRGDDRVLREARPVRRRRSG